MPKLDKPLEENLGHLFPERDRVDWITFEMPYSDELFLRLKKWAIQNKSTTKPTEHLREYLRIALEDPHLQMQFKLEFSELITDQWGKL